VCTFTFWAYLDFNASAQNSEMDQPTDPNKTSALLRLSYILFNIYPNFINISINTAEGNI